MQIAKMHIININMLMQKHIASYIKSYVTIDKSDVSTMQMYADDVAHNANALAAFNNSNLRKKDVQNLHDKIMLQDTLVREHFFAVLQYIENNNLIAAQNFCCS